jgi:two-component system, cell cycle sensor histidine kinase and response regulator CckA
MSAKTSLQEDDGFFQAIFSQAAFGIAQIDIDGRWLRLNDRFCNLLGYTEAELRNTYQDVTYPDDREAALIGSCRLLAGEIAEHSIRKRLVCKDGTIVWAKRHLSLIRDENKSPRYFVSVIEDITEQIAAEEALRQNELWTKQVFDNIPECIFVLDVTPEGRFKFVALNPAEEDAVGLSTRDVSGKFIEDVLPDEVSKKVIANYRRCLEAGSLISYQDELNLEVGRRYFHTNLIPLRDAAGRIYRIAGCCTDLTDIRRTDEQALARQKLESIGVLANGIAHDFNNLLGGILICSELALAENENVSTVQEQLKRIRMSSIRGAEIVRQLMIYGGKESPDFQPVEISALVCEMLDLLKVSISKHISVRVELGSDLPPVHASAAQIRQIVMNLITNASEAIGRRDGVISVSSALRSVSGNSPSSGNASLPEGDYVQLQISDSGPGMTPEVQARIFDPFFSTKRNGRGLGLPVVQGVVRTHGGTIDVQSTPGQGTTFQILLPCENGTASSTQIPVPEAARIIPRAGTILVVEDEDILRSAVSKMLRNRGYSIFEANDGQKAIATVRDFKDDLDLILLDVTLPGVISSREIVEEVQRTRAGLKIILTSAYGKEDVAPAFAGVGIEHFIRKPFVIADLMGLVRSVLSAP